MSHTGTFIPWNSYCRGCCQVKGTYTIKYWSPLIDRSISGVFPLYLLAMPVNTNDQNDLKHEGMKTCFDKTLTDISI